MARDKLTIKKISASELKHLKERGFVRRSDIYRYLEKNYRHLIERKVGTNDGPSWDETAAVMSRGGYLNARGSALNGHAVRRVFRRVEQDIRRREKEAAHETAKSHRSRQREDWRPPITVATPRSPAQMAPAGPSVPTVRGGEDLPPRHSTSAPAAGAGAAEQKMTIADLSPEGRAKIDRLREQFAETDRKRFGSF